MHTHGLAEQFSLYTLKAHEKPPETFSLAVRALQDMIEEIPRNHKCCPAHGCSHGSAEQFSSSVSRNPVWSFGAGKDPIG